MTKNHSQTGYEIIKTMEDVLKAILEAPIYEDMTIKDFFKNSGISFTEIICSGGD